MAKIEIEAQTKGFEEAAEDVEKLAEALDAFPSTINFKAKDCEINIHNTNWIEQKQPKVEYAKGGIVEEDKGPEVILMNDSVSRMLKDKIVPQEELKEKMWRIALKSIKEMCTSTTVCSECIFGDRERTCNLYGDPGDWDL